MSLIYIIRLNKIYNVMKVEGEQWEIYARKVKNIMLK